MGCANALRATASISFCLVLVSGTPSLAWAHPCGLPWDTRIFTPDNKPLQNYHAFVQGQIGIVRGGLDSTHLFVPWRYLNGLSLPSATADALADRFGCYPRKQQDDSISPPEGELEQAQRQWLSARQKIKDPPLVNPPESTHRLYRWSSSYDYPGYLNCTASAFRTAAATLAERERMHGSDRMAIADWAVAQDQVFANCPRPNELPHDVPTGSPGWLSRDRWYQQAAALFYAERYEEAIKAFDDIAQDAESPWRTLAPYLAARAQLRQGTVHRARGKLDATPLELAEQRLQRILADSNLAEQHTAARRMLGFVELRLHPEERLGELDRALSAEPLPDDVPQTLIDHSYLLVQLGRAHQLKVSHGDNESSSTDDAEVASAEDGEGD